MDESRIRQIVQDELRRSSDKARFKLNTIPNHIHNGKDSPLIKAENIVPSTSIVGNVEMASVSTYTVNLNSSFTPKTILAYGTITGTYSGQATRILTIGSAQLSPTFYLQPETTRTVVTGNIQYPFPTEQPDGSTPSVPAQSSSYISVTRGGTSNFYAGSSEDHIVSVAFPSTSEIKARATITDFSRDKVVINVPYLDSGWSIFLTLVIS
jgi:hypothetical protein